MRRFLLAALALLALAGAWLLHRLNDRPSLEPWSGLWLASADPDAQGPHVSVTFLGVATLLVSDGETALLTDGFFSRPPKTSVFFGRIAPTPTRSPARCNAPASRSSRQ